MHQTSGTSGLLMDVIDTVNDAFFWRRPLSREQRERAATAIAARQGLNGAYASTFALTDGERRRGIKLFTGEATQSAAARHIAGEEACRALCLLQPRDRAARLALERASTGLMKCLVASEKAREHRMGGNPGTFCCGRCSVAVWRHVLAGGFDRREERLSAGIKRLRTYRDGKSGWRVFPFWYTVAALVEMEHPQAAAEIRHAATRLERAASRRRSDDSPWVLRRQEIARRALAKL